MNELVEKWNKSTVALKSVVGFFAGVVAIVLFYAQVRDHLQDEHLHGDAFNRDWQKRIEKIEDNLRSNLFTEKWRDSIKNNSDGLRTIVRRSTQRYNRNSEGLKKVNNLIKSVFDVKVSSEAEKIK